MNKLGKLIRSQLSFSSKEWKSELFYRHYEENDNNKITFRSQPKFTKQPSGHKSIDSVREHMNSITDIQSQEIKKVYAFTVDLQINPVAKTDRLMTHHFIEVITWQGYAYTIEKQASFLAIQSCRHQDRSDRPIRIFCDGQKRPNFWTLTEIGSTCNLKKRTTVKDILDVIEEKQQLSVKYHVVNANCQEFARLLWQECVSDPYPLILESVGGDGRTFQFEVTTGDLVIHYIQNIHMGFVAFFAFLALLMQIDIWIPICIFAIIGVFGLLSCILLISFSKSRNCNPKVLDVSHESEITGKTVSSKVVEFPLIRHGWESSNRFPGGHHFVSGVLQEQLIIWGGRQVNQDDSGESIYKCLPHNIMYTHKLSADLTKIGCPLTWRAMQVTGAIHPGRYGASFCVLSDQLYLFGGCEVNENLEKSREKQTNVLTKLSVNGVFTKVDYSGLKPPPTISAQSWTHDGKMFIFGGSLKGPWQDVDVSPSNYVKRRHSAKEYYTNNFFQYDPTNDEMSRVEASGNPPRPGVGYGIAKLREKVFVHLGSCNVDWLLSFHKLDMATMQWSTISKVCDGLAKHTLSPISSHELLRVGGWAKNGPSKRVEVYDLDREEWSGEASLPLEFGGENGGLRLHNAIPVEREGGTAVICLGGYVSPGWNENAFHAIIFEKYRS